jgi:feruloyl esterase
MSMKAILLVIVGWSAITGSAARASVLPDTLGATQCKALENVDFSGIQEAPTKVTQANLVEPSGEVPAHCQVEGYVTPNVGFNLLLPLSNWNGKFLERGCGGDCGSSSTSDVLNLCSDPLRRGYACIISDMGHKGWGGLWAYNNLQAQVDFGYRGAHVTALAGKAITEYYYGKAPKYAYFTGCSTGGRQALVEAQRFPWDFDGIVAGAPWINDSDSAMQYVWNDVVLSNKDGKPLLNHADLELVHDAALSKCDMDDGVKDGIIGNPLACNFDPGELVCKSEKNSKCITRAQADAVKKVYSGPTTSRGKKLYTGGSPIGSELAWVGVSLSNGNAWAIPYFRYEVMPPAGPNWQESDFNFDRDYKRFEGGVQESLLNAANPDLRKFKSGGGKLILFQGGMDSDVVPANTIDYYQTVEKTMGGRAATQEFFRLFIVPGMKHCSGGPGAFAIDYLSYLENWVERGQAPDLMLGAHVKEPTMSFPLSRNDHILFTRPVYPYPLQAKYKSSGDPNDASSFRSVEP